MSVKGEVDANESRHRQSTWKIGLTLVIIVSVSLIPPENWPALGMILVGVFVALSVAGVSVRYLMRRLALFLPMLLIFGLTIPMTESSGIDAWSWTFALCLRCLISFLAGLWLIHVLPFSDLLATLLRWHCPKLLVAMLAFMYRYIFILWDELARLKNARAARDFGEVSLISRWMNHAQMIGLLVLRAMERAERTHHAMLARGWDGSPRFLGDDPVRKT